MSPARHTLHVATGEPYTVSIGTAALEEARAFLRNRGGSMVLLTDAQVGELYLERLAVDAPTMVLPPGEATKSFGHLERTLDFMADTGLDRNSCLVAFGGGVIGDLGGLAASLYMRGVDVVQLPTTLLSQVDSSVGGKTAVNLGAGKNLAGTFHQPRAVFADIATLATLSDEEFRSGLGEVVKSALIGDPALLDLLARESQDVRRRDPELLVEIVQRSICVKATVVAADERESGERKKLNLGHTFAHAIEHVAGYGKIPHGVAVGVGLQLALLASAMCRVLEDPGLPERLASLLDGLGMCTDLATLRRQYGVALPGDALEEAMRLDKKGVAGLPRFVLVRNVGAVPVDCPLQSTLLEELFR